MRRPAALSRPDVLAGPGSPPGPARPSVRSRALATVAGRLRTAPLPPPNRLHTAVAVLFALDGFVFGSWAARVPDVSIATGAGHSGLGVALLCLSLGALACMQLTGALCARLGPGLVSAVSGVLLSLTAVLPGLTGSLPALCAALLVFGAGTGAVNVAANSLGVQVEARAGRPLLSGLHAAFSAGGLLGALAGGLVSSALGVAPHLVAVALLGLAVMAWAAPVLIGADRDRAPSRTESRPAGQRVDRRPTAALVVLGAIAGATAYGEGALSDWGALHLREHLAAAPALAAAGYAGFSCAMAAARLAGGQLVLLLGEKRLLVGGALVAAAGALTAVTTSSLPIALTGYAVVGLGLANVFPLAIARAGALGGPSGVALATTVGYTGLLGGPPVIGFVAEHAGLPVALSSVAVLAAVAAALVLSLDGGRVRVPALPRTGPAWVVPVAGGLRPVVVRVRGGAGAYARDLDMLSVG